MTNYQIIYNEIVNREIMTAEKLDGFIARYGDIPFHTFKEWQKLGRQVKKGEKALFKVSLWRFGQKNVEVKTPEGETKTEKLERYYMQDSHIFSFDQTEKKPTFKTRNADELREYNKMLADQRKQKAEQSKPEQTNLFTPEKVTTTATSRQAEPANTNQAEPANTNQAEPGKKPRRTPEQMLFVKAEPLISDFLKNKINYAKFKSDAFMDLVVENIGDNNYSIAHYYEQNGDLMRDPEITFIVDQDKKEIRPTSFKQDNLGLFYEVQNQYQEKDLTRFFGTWLSNIQKQGFEKHKAT